MKSALNKQATHLANMDKTLQEDRLIQLSQVALLQNRVNSDITIDERANEHLTKIKENTEKTASNIISLFKELKNHSEGYEKKDKAKKDNPEKDKPQKNKTAEKDLAPPTSEKRSWWSGTEQDRKEFKTTRGVLKQSGLISEGGMFDSYLQQRENKKQPIEETNKPTAKKSTEKTKPGKTSAEKANANEPLSFSNEGKLKKEKSTEKTKPGKTSAEKANANDPLSFSDESQLEQQRSQEKSVALLEKIEENTRGAKGAASTPPKESQASGGLLDSIMGFIGPSIASLFKSIFNPRNLLKAFTKVFIPAMIIGSIVNGIVDAFKTFFNGGSFLDVMIAGLGGVLSFLTFGLIDGKTIEKIANFMGGFIDEYVITPIKDFVSYIGESFNKYIAEPLATAFAPITNFFKQIKDQVFGFLEDFGIPEIGFSTPFGKVSIGPFYPFRPKEGTEKVTSKEKITSSSSSDSGTTRTIAEGTTVTGSKTSDVMVEDSTTSEKDGRVSQARGRMIATFDTKTGTSSISDAQGERKDISNRAFRQIKSASKEEGTNTTVIRDIIKEDEAYQKLGFFDKLKVDTGFAKATELVKVEKPTVSTGNAVYNQSSKNTEMAMKPAQTQTPIVVSAPTTNNTTKQSIAMPAPVRNQDSEFGRYVSRRALVI
jgi:hypothetical protein